MKIADQVAEGRCSDQDDDSSFASSETTTTRTEGASGSASPNINSSSPKQATSLAERESRHVFLSRLVVLSVLLLSALGVSLGVYFYLAAAEQTRFEQQFKSDARKVLDSIGRGLDHTLGSADGFAVKHIAFARDTNATWPYVTIPDYAVQATKLLRLSKALIVATFSLVYPHQRPEWEKYASKNLDWIDNSLDVQEGDSDHVGPISRVYGISYSITKLGSVPKDAPEPQYGAYLPTWQHLPVMPGNPNSSVVNYDGLTAPYAGGARWNAATELRASITGYTTQYAFWVKHFIPADEDPNEPMSSLSYPVVDSLDSIRIGEDVLSGGERAVAVLGFNFLWRDYIRNILPVHSVGIHIVFHQAECGPPFTYQLDGPRAIYLGEGDLHEPRFDDLVQSARMTELMNDDYYTGLPLDETICTKSLSVYPSSTMEGSYKTSNPAVISLVAAIVFVFTSIVFLAYDFLVARRQRTVLKHALVSQAVVENLFPGNVKQELYEERERENQARNKLAKFRAGANPTLDFPITNDTIDASSGSAGGTRNAANLPKGRIAKLYESTTICMADIDGFDDWSKQRTPSQTFQFLELVLGAFDQIAAVRGVLKIENVADSYVTVTGVPDPQKDHAVRMVKFARACMTKLNHLTPTLAEEYGDETCLLKLRVGINSGSIIGGMLRSNKARFQLFGDTINTAARMQTTGEAGRIHASEGTAQELQLAGKQHWLTCREDKVQAKGKGELQTFWISNRGQSSGSVATRTTTGSVVNGFQERAAAEMHHDNIEPTSAHRSDGLGEDAELEELEKRLFQRIDV